MVKKNTWVLDTVAPKLFYTLIIVSITFWSSFVCVDLIPIADLPGQQSHSIESYLKELLSTGFCLPAQQCFFFFFPLHHSIVSYLELFHHLLECFPSVSKVSFVFRVFSALLWLCPCNRYVCGSWVRKRDTFSFVEKEPWLPVYVENVTLCFHSSVNLSKNVPHLEGHPKGSNLLEPWVQITNVFGSLRVEVQIILELF